MEIRIGDKIARSDVIEDAKRNPNFSRPLIILNEVQLPTLFYYAPPLTFNLFDRRSFGREPHIGICVVQDFAKYISTLSKVVKTLHASSGLFHWKFWSFRVYLARQNSNF